MLWTPHLTESWEDAEGVRQLYTDGGVQEGGRAGVYGWTVLKFGDRATAGEHKGRPEVMRQVKGGGRLLSNEEAENVQRAETAAFVAGVIANKTWLKNGGKLAAHIDNQGVVDCYVKKKFSGTGRWWVAQQDHDLWDLLMDVLDVTDAWDRVEGPGPP